MFILTDDEMCLLNDDHDNDEMRGHSLMCQRPFHSQSIPPDLSFLSLFNSLIHSFIFLMHSLGETRPVFSCRSKEGLGWVPLERRGNAGNVM